MSWYVTLCHEKTPASGCVPAVQQCRRWCTAAASVLIGQAFQQWPEQSRAWQQCGSSTSGHPACGSLQLTAAHCGSLQAWPCNPVITKQSQGGHRADFERVAWHCSMQPHHHHPPTGTHTVPGTNRGVSSTAPCTPMHCWHLGHPLAPGVGVHGDTQRCGGGSWHAVACTGMVLQPTVCWLHSSG